MRIKEYFGYYFREDGAVFKKNGIDRMKVREHNGTLLVKLFIDGKSRYVLLHRVMYYLFVEEFDISNKDLCVIAKDKDFTNVSLDNLELKARNKIIQGHNNTRAKLTDEEVEQIRREYKGRAGTNNLDKKTPSYFDLAKKYGVTKGYIRGIVKGVSRNKEKYKL